MSRFIVKKHKTQTNSKQSVKKSTNLSKTVSIASCNIIHVVMTSLVLFVNKLEKIVYIFEEIKISLYICWIFLDNHPTESCNRAGNVIQIVVVLALTLNNY